MVMGDLVLTEDEIAPVMKQLVQDGLEVTGVHNHILRALPATLYMHIAGTGDAAKLGKAIHGALAKSKTPLEAAPSSNQDVGLDTAALDQALGQKGKASGGVYQFSIPRAEPIKEGGMETPPAMGTAIAINFQSAGQGNAATTGDFVLLPEEVNPVIQALLANGIEVTALHTHMLAEEPRLYFMHFWGVDQPDKLATGLKAALAKVNIAHSEENTDGPPCPLPVASRHRDIHYGLGGMPRCRVNRSAADGGLQVRLREKPGGLGTARIYPRSDREGAAARLEDRRGSNSTRGFEGGRRDKRRSNRHPLPAVDPRRL
jgi:hypothetical protein